MGLTTILRMSTSRAAPLARNLLPTSFSSARHDPQPCFTRLMNYESLRQEIESEIMRAKETIRTKLMMDKGYRTNCTIKENLGQKTISLSRMYEGEFINIDIHMPRDDDDDENDNSEDEKLIVKVAKSCGMFLEFGCTVHGNAISIDTLSIKDSKDQLGLLGPKFSDLGENLQKAFHKYLEIRGITSCNINVFHEYFMIRKDRKSNLAWLRRLQEFIDSGTLFDFAKRRDETFDFSEQSNKRVETSDSDGSDGSDDSDDEFGVPLHNILKDLNAREDNQMKRNEETQDNITIPRCLH